MLTLSARLAESGGRGVSDRVRIGVVNRHTSLGEGLAAARRARWPERLELACELGYSWSRTCRSVTGIIGANPDRGWAAEAHIPALTPRSTTIPTITC
jgi:hypothetical protein